MAGSERLCFCQPPAFGGLGPSNGPAVSLEEFTTLALAEVHFVADPENATSICDSSVVADAVDCRLGGRDHVEFESTLYIELSGDNTVDGATLDLFEKDCRFMYNQIMFDDLSSEDFFQIDHCKSRCAFNETAILDAGLQILQDKWLILTAVGQAFLGAGSDSYPFARDGGRRLHEQTKNQGGSVSRRFHERKAARSGGAGQRELNFLLRDETSGDDFCFCSEDAAGARADSLPSVEQVLLSSLQQHTIVERIGIEECGTAEIYEQTLYITLGDAVLTEATTLAFRKLLQDFFNDLTIGAFDLQHCSLFYPFVFNVERLEDFDDQILRFNIQFLAYNVDLVGPSILFQPVYDPIVGRRLEMQHSSPQRQDDEKLNSKIPSEASTVRKVGDSHQARFLLEEGVEPACYCEELASLENPSTPFLFDVNRLLNEVLCDGTAIPGITSVNIFPGGYDDDNTEPDAVFKRDLTCPDPDEIYQVNLGLTLAGGEAEPDVEQVAEALREAYTIANLNDCDRPFFRAIVPDSPRFLFFEPSESVLMFEFLINSRGLPDPATATSPPAAAANIFSRRLESSLPFCTIDQILDGLSVEDAALCVQDLEMGASVNPCGDCGIPRNDTAGCSCAVCESSVCSYDSFCCDSFWDFACVAYANEDPNCVSIPCNCPWNGCYCSGDDPSPGRGPTEEEVFAEFQVIASELFPAPALVPPGRERRELQGIGAMSLTEYTAQNCSNIEREGFTILFIFYVDGELTQAQAEALVDLVVVCFNEFNEDSCEPSFTRILSASLIAFSVGRRRDQEQGSRDLQLQSVLTIQANSEGSAEAARSGLNVRRRRQLKELSHEEGQHFTMHPTLENGSQRAGRRLFAVDINGTVECYCPTHGSNTGVFISGDVLLDKLNDSQNFTTVEDVDPIVETNATGCRDFTEAFPTSTVVIVTLATNFDELTPAERSAIELSFLQNHNNQTLTDCGPNATLALSARMVEYPFVSDDGTRRNLQVNVGSNGAAIILGGVGAGSSGEGGWYGQTSGRRRQLDDSPQQWQAAWTLDELHGRELQEEIFCFCTNGNGALPDLGLIVGGVNDDLGEVVLLEGLEVEVVSCEFDNVLLGYRVSVLFSQVPTAEQAEQFETLLVAEFNHAYAEKCDLDLIVLSFAFDNRRRLSQHVGNIERRLQGLQLPGTLVAVPAGGASGENPPTLFNIRRRFLLDGGVTAEVQLGTASPFGAAKNKGQPRSLQGTDVEVIGPFTGSINCTCNSARVGADGALDQENVTAADINDALEDALDANPNIDIETAEITPGEPESELCRCEGKTEGLYRRRRGRGGTRFGGVGRTIFSSNCDLFPDGYIRCDGVRVIPSGLIDRCLCGPGRPREYNNNDGLVEEEDNDADRSLRRRSRVPSVTKEQGNGVLNKWKNAVRRRHQQGWGKKSIGDCLETFECPFDLPPNLPC